MVWIPDIGLLRRWRKTKPEPAGVQVDFSAQLRAFHDDGWVSLELLLVNRSDIPVWVESATVVLSELDANWQASISTGEARHQVLQAVWPHDTLRVSLASAIYEAAGRPQGTHSCFLHSNVHYRVFDELCNVQLETCRVEMVALSVVSLRSAHWYDKKIKQINRPVDFTTQRRED